MRLSYTVRHLGLFFDIEFNKQVTDRTRANLEELGCIYLSGARSWRGKNLVEAEAIKIADEAVKKSAHAQRMGIKSSVKQPCADCKKAGYGNLSECPWERDFLPVPGWDAEPTLIGSNLTSYAIKHCPLYEKQA